MTSRSNVAIPIPLPPAPPRDALPSVIGVAPAWDNGKLLRFDRFTQAFVTVFPRVDQFQRFREYLRGLLEPGHRKNMGAIASRATASTPEANATQAIQHFVTDSPWDPDRLLAAARGTVGRSLDDPDAVWVVHDGVIPKKGRHSVGAQRQFARSLNRKLNCQLAVVVSQVGPRGFFPLAARLYLPAGWLREHRAFAEKTVPEEHRRALSKSAIALALIGELWREGGRRLAWPPRAATPRPTSSRKASSATAWRRTRRTKRRYRPPARASRG